jgi:hypothetical protein
MDSSIIELDRHELAALIEWLQRPNGAHEPVPRTSYPKHRVWFEAVEGGHIWIRVTEKV